MPQPNLSEAEFDGLVTTDAPAQASSTTTVTPSHASAVLTPETPVAEPEAPPAELPVPEPEPEPEPETVEATPRDEAGRFTEGKGKKPSVQARINEAIRKQRDAEREAAHWREQAQRAQPPQPAFIDPSDPEPTIDQFQNTDDPYLALTKAAARWAARQEAKVMYHAQAEQARATKYTQDVQRLITSLPNGKELKALADTMPAPHPELRSAILDSDAAARLVLYFAEHPEDYDQLQRLSGPGLHRALGTIEGRLSAAQSGPAPQARVTPVITPIKPVGTSPVSTTPAPDDLEFGPEYIRAMNAKDRERKKLHF